MKEISLEFTTGNRTYGGWVGEREERLPNIKKSRYVDQAEGDPVIWYVRKQWGKTAHP